MKHSLDWAYAALAPFADRWKKERRTQEAILERALAVKDEIGIHRPRVLDVGCGVGLLTFALRRSGFDAEGIDKYVLEEWGKVGVEKAWRKNGMRITVADFFDHPYPLKSFDLIVNENMIEHLRFQAREFFEKCRTLLRPGGHLILTTPNATSLLKRARMLLGRSPYWDFEDFFLRGQPYGHVREWTAGELIRAGCFMGLEIASLVYLNAYSRKGWWRRPKKWGGLLSSLLSEYLVPSLRDTIIVTYRKIGDEDGSPPTS